MKFWSKINIVILLARTGIEIIKRVEVIKIDQQNSDILNIKDLLILRLIIEIIKFIDLKIDDNPLIWREKIIKFIDRLFWIDSGGYNVHPE